MSEVDIDRFGSRRSTVYAENGVVSTSQPLASQAGLRVLQDGGNAFDAAVATAAALNVTEATSTGLGGDVFMLYRTADGEIGGMQSCGHAASGATIERTRQAIADEEGIDPGEAEMPLRGPHTVTVPGTARGWEATIDGFGRGSLADALAPAIDYAIGGFPVTEIIASRWKYAEGLFADPHAREEYLVDGERAPRVGERIYLPNLGQSMERIAEEGADVVYEGDIAEKIAAEVQSKGGFMTVEDLAEFEPRFVDPVSTTYRGAEVYELPPNNQGLIALEALNIAEEIDAGSHPYESAERVHYFAEAMKLAFRDGHYYITDPDFEEVPALEDKEYARTRAREIGEEALADVPLGMRGARAEYSDTVLLCVADGEGNLVSYINSRFKGFGSGLVAGDTGFALQNRGTSFTLDPDHPNRLEPGKRPFHTLVPSIVGFGEDDWAAFGVMGGAMQPQGHYQVLANMLDYDMPLQQALDAPRWRYQESGRLAIESRFDDAIYGKLDRRGHDLQVRQAGYFGGAQIARNQAGVLSGATEPRKDGLSVGY